jgi:anti-sigma regulatory factor (Ser/Thr protein kinase)
MHVARDLRPSAGAVETGVAFRHEILLYAGEDGFVEGTLPFIDDALAAEEPVLVAVTRARIETLEEALGDDAERVRFMDVEALGRNPARLIPAWHRFLIDHASEGRQVRGIGEPVWPGRSAAELSECERHESLLNLAFDDGRPWRLLCPYDLNNLDEETIEAAQRSHPFITENSSSRRSDAYRCPDNASGPFDGALPPPLTPATQLTFGGDQLRTLRRAVAEWAAGTLLGPERTEHLVLAVSELATNSVCHGGGTGTLRMWREEGTLLCEVSDRGRIIEPLVGRVRPTLVQQAGRGMWLVNQLCDLVQIRTTATGSVVRVHMRLV